MKESQIFKSIIKYFQNNPGYLNTRNIPEVCKRHHKVNHCIFDLDGAILDNQHLIDNANKQLFDMYELQYTTDWRYQLMGRTDQSMWEKVAKDLNLEATWQKLHHEYTQFLTETPSENIPLKPGIEKLLAHLRKHRIPMAMVTSSPRSMMEMKTEHIKDLMENFSFIICGDDECLIKQSKPSKEVYNACREHFQAKPKPENCLVFENTPNGVLAARLAHMQVVGVTNILTPAQSLLYAHETVETLRDFNPDKYGLPPIPGQLD